MNKQEFLIKLSDCLDGYVSASEKQESIDYYRNYIEEEMGFGKTEQEVLDDLGSPAGIAKSIISARGVSSKDPSNSYHYDVYEETREEHKNSPVYGKVFHFDGWKMGAILVMIIIIVLIVLSIGFKIAVALLPILLPVLILMYIFKKLTNRR